MFLFLGLPQIIMSGRGSLLTWNDQAVPSTTCPSEGVAMEDSLQNQSGGSIEGIGISSWRPSAITLALNEAYCYDWLFLQLLLEAPRMEGLTVQRGHHTKCDTVEGKINFLMHSLLVARDDTKHSSWPASLNTSNLLLNSLVPGSRNSLWIIQGRKYGTTVVS